MGPVQRCHDPEPGHADAIIAACRLTGPAAVEQEHAEVLVAVQVSRARDRRVPPPQGIAHDEPGNVPAARRSRAAQLAVELDAAVEEEEAATAVGDLPGTAAARRKSREKGLRWVDSDGWIDAIDRLWVDVLRAANVFLFPSPWNKIDRITVSRSIRKALHIYRSSSLLDL